MRVQLGAQPGPGPPAGSGRRSQPSPLRRLLSHAHLCPPPDTAWHIYLRTQFQRIVLSCFEVHWKIVREPPGGPPREYWSQAWPQAAAVEPLRRGLGGASPTYWTLIGHPHGPAPGAPARSHFPLTSVSSHALGSGWSGLLKLDLDLPNEKRASQGLSGKAAGLYKRALGRILALGVRRGSLRRV